MSNLWSKKIQSTEVLYYSRMARFNDYNKKEWFEMLGIKDGDKVLEVGCGSGHFCNMIKKYYPNCEVYGIDIDEGHINFAKQKSKQLGLDINYQIADIKEQYRILKNKGKIVVMGVATYESIHSNRFDYLLDEYKLILDKLKFNKSIQVGKYASVPEEIMKNLIQYGFYDCNYITKKIVYYNPDCQNDILISRKQIYDEYISNKANDLFLLKNAKNGEKYSRQLLELNNQRYKKRLELLENEEKIFDFQITNVFTICAQKDSSIIN